MSNTSAAVEATKPQARSRVSNGNALFGREVDGRSAWARRLRDLIEDHVADLGGVDAISAAEKSIVRRAATLTVELELLEARFALAEIEPDGDLSFHTACLLRHAADLDLYQRSAANLRRLLESLGLERRARDVTPPLAGYLAARVSVAAGSAPSAPRRDAVPEPATRTSGDPGGLA